MPSKPMLFLITPIYSAQSVRNATAQFKLNELDGKFFNTNQTINSLVQSGNSAVDMNELIKKIA